MGRGWGQQDGEREGLRGWILLGWVSGFGEVGAALGRSESAEWKDGIWESWTVGLGREGVLGMGDLKAAAADGGKN